MQLQHGCCILQNQILYHAGHEPPQLLLHQGYGSGDKGQVVLPAEQDCPHTRWCIVGYSQGLHCLLLLYHHLMNHLLVPQHFLHPNSVYHHWK
nr:hypothetical protein Iba_scaffold26771CG0010 [Ipomoea batatas]